MLWQIKVGIHTGGLALTQLDRWTNCLHLLLAPIFWWFRDKGLRCSPQKTQRANGALPSWARACLSPIDSSSLVVSGSEYAPDARSRSEEASLHWLLVFGSSAKLFFFGLSIFCSIYRLLPGITPWPSQDVAQFASKSNFNLNNTWSLHLSLSDIFLTLAFKNANGYGVPLLAH